MMSSLETSSPVSASTLAYLMRWPVFRLIWLKLIFSESEVAGYKATGQVTRERRKNPFQLARELSPEVGDGGNRKGGISWGCLTPPLLHRRSDMPCPTITSPS